MVGENEATTVGKDDNAHTGGGPKRERSSIGFPYMDLDDAMGVATAIHANVGTGTCSSDQLAAWLKQSPTSSAFRVRLSAGRMFGLIDTERGDSIKLTPLGQKAVDPKQERGARVDAFLSVPLYQAVYEKFKGAVLPPAAALEREIVALGVAEKQKGRARQVMERAADQAGFFQSGKDRLVKPGIAQNNQQPPPADPGGGGGGDGNLPGLDPIIGGLLKRLPTAGDNWPESERKLWLQLLEGSFKLIYQDSAQKEQAAPEGGEPHQ